jgi:hypothetical protein
MSLSVRGFGGVVIFSIGVGIGLYYTNMTWLVHIQSSRETISVAFLDNTYFEQS